ncbi:fatty acyl-CoA reductase 2-like isoform X2 [Chenopodium quinoa]|uniref:fatty acyl-CoA reductase 2-like isoform X2 n=1 Tax=Chenopodium quinoa TaxID=63459 RepID=UPI000B7809D4|nr:fatty acyl-CoA reductase 2-like isoform X2 [Chenopodium quinoa]
MANQSNANQGIGIVNFLKHKTYFVVGSTGFTGKVFIEKLLWEVPEVEKIYLLLRAKNAEGAAQRLKTEIIDCEVFARLKNEHGERYEEFMNGKLVAVAGNITDHPCLGMDVDLARAIANQIDVIVNIAADARWHARYDVLLDVNVRGISRLLTYAMDCKKLLLFFTCFNREHMSEKE